MKIGLLKCDTVMPELRHIAGDYSDAFAALFSQHAPDISLEVYEVERGQYPRSPDECEGYITTGSRCSVYDTDPWILRFKDYVAELCRSHTKLVGICFGHQMIAEALGGKCVCSERGWGVGVKNVRVTAKKPWMQPELQAYNLIACHLDQVIAMPEGSEILAENDHCPISMYALGDHFLSIQDHPEFTPAYAEALMLTRVERIGRERVEQARKSLTQETHNGIIARWIENFFRSA